MKDDKGNKIIRALAGVIGGAILSIIVSGLFVSMLEFHVTTVLPVVLFGSVVGGVLGFIYPRVAAVLIEFFG